MQPHCGVLLKFALDSLPSLGAAAVGAAVVARLAVVVNAAVAGPAAGLLL